MEFTREDRRRRALGLAEHLTAARIPVERSVVYVLTPEKLAPARRGGSNRRMRRAGEAEARASS
ncbi:MAG: hypothetical protein JWN86_728 [Planctomycetota bacterium]|nr:hypothetical protein [Planctomycetota bacterium]